MRRPLDPLPFLIIAFCLMWSSAFAAAKVAVAECPPLLLLMTRCLIAGAVILGIRAATGAGWRMKRRDVMAFAALGIANNTLYLGLNHIGAQTVSAGLIALISSANPVLTALLAALVLGERMTWRKAAGLFLGVCGVAIVVNSRIAGGADSPVGIALTLGALASLVAGTIIFKKLAPRGGLWLGNAIQCLSGGLAVSPFALTFESFGDIVPDAGLLTSVAYLTLVSIFGYALWFHLLRVCGASRASSYHFLMPPLGVLFGWLVLGEHLNPIDLAGIIPVALGVYLVTRAPGHATRQQPYCAVTP